MPSILTPTVALKDCLNFLLHSNYCLMLQPCSNTSKTLLMCQTNHFWAMFIVSSVIYFFLLQPLPHLLYPCLTAGTTTFSSISSTTCPTVILTYRKPHQTVLLKKIYKTAQHIINHLNSKITRPVSRDAQIRSQFYLCYKTNDSQIDTKSLIFFMDT